MRNTVLILIIFCTAIYAQENDKWQPLDYFIGTWIGQSTGKAGTGIGERTYEYIMKGTFLYYKNIMKFEPQEQNPEGETHEDWGIFSTDSDRNKFILRQFNIEDFVNRYVVDSISATGKFMILNSEESENAPPGLRARLIYEIKNDNEFYETFELKFGDKNYSCWMTNIWKKK